MKLSISLAVNLSFVWLSRFIILAYHIPYLLVFFHIPYLLPFPFKHFIGWFPQFVGGPVSVFLIMNWLLLILLRCGLLHCKSFIIHMYSIDDLIIIKERDFVNDIASPVSCTRRGRSYPYRYQLERDVSPFVAQISHLITFRNHWLFFILHCTVWLLVSA